MTTGITTTNLLGCHTIRESVTNTVTFEYFLRYRAQNWHQTLKCMIFSSKHFNCFTKKAVLMTWLIESTYGTVQKVAPPQDKMYTHCLIVHLISDIPWQFQFDGKTVSLYVHKATNFCVNRHSTNVVYSDHDINISKFCGKKWKRVRRNCWKFSEY